VAVLSSQNDADLPVFWWTPGPPCNGCYVPFFVHGGGLPKIVSRAGTFGKKLVPPPQASPDSYRPDSYWWLFRKLMDTVKGDPIRSLPGYYPKRNTQVRARFDALEMEFADELPKIVQQATASADGVNAEVLDNFTQRCVEKVVKTTRDLLESVFAPEDNR
jgi:secernin